MALTWIEYRGHKILYNDFRGLTEAQMTQQLDDELALLKAQPKKVRMLVDVTNSATGPGFMARAKALASQIDAHVERQAILGIDGIKAILLRAFNAMGSGTLAPFANEEAAKEYLISSTK
jgi:hypothetical protein